MTVAEQTKGLEDKDFFHLIESTRKLGLQRVAQEDLSVLNNILINAGTAGFSETQKRRIIDVASKYGLAEAPQIKPPNGSPSLKDRLANGPANGSVGPIPLKDRMRKEFVMPNAFKLTVVSIGQDVVIGKYTDYPHVQVNISVPISAWNSKVHMMASFLTSKGVPQADDVIYGALAKVPEGSPLPLDQTIGQVLYVCKEGETLRFTTKRDFSAAERAEADAASHPITTPVVTPVVQPPGFNPNSSEQQAQPVEKGRKSRVRWFDSSMIVVKRPDHFSLVIPERGQIQVLKTKSYKQKPGDKVKCLIDVSSYEGVLSYAIDLAKANDVDTLKRFMLFAANMKVDPSTVQDASDDTDESL